MAAGAGVSARRDNASTGGPQWPVSGQGGDGRRPGRGLRDDRLAFDHRDWMRRLGAGLERVVDSATRFHGVPTGLESSMRIEDFEAGWRRRYRELGALANEHPYAAKLFEESHIWLDEVPDDVRDALSEHPVLAAARGYGSGEAFAVGAGTSRWRLEMKPLVAHLAKLSVRTGGEYAATRLHRFLAAGAAGRLHGHEIIVLYGLKVNEPIRLGPASYLADYDGVRRRFGLDENPERWLDGSGGEPDTDPGRPAWESSRSVLVRGFNWGPAVAQGRDRLSDGDGWWTQRYSFPDGQAVSSAVEIFEGRKTVLQLLSIAVGSKLVSHTVIVALPRWMRQIDPNLRNQQDSGRGMFDVRPKDRTPSAEDVRAFAAAARGWLRLGGRAPPKIRLAMDRLVSSYGPAAKGFGFAEPIVDASIALESLYGPFGGRSITRKLAQRAAWLLGGSDPGRRRKIERELRLFYGVRSKIVHGAEPLEYHERRLKAYLHKGRTVARETLLAMLDRGTVANTDREWNDLVSGRVRRP